MVHGKIIDKWHAGDIWVHTSDIRVTHQYIRVTYDGWHMSTYEWHTSYILVPSLNLTLYSVWSFAIAVFNIICGKNITLRGCGWLWLLRCSDFCIFHSNILNLVKILQNTIVIKNRSRTSTNVKGRTPCNNTVIYGFQPKTIVTNSSIFAVGMGLESTSCKVRFFKHLRFLSEPNKELRFLRNTIAEVGLGTPPTHSAELFFIIFNLWKLLTSI